jgi:Circularly permutated YpsA SLOG family
MIHIKKIISGGQTGVDQAALRAAIASGIPIDGWCSPGRICEDGIIPKEFLLKETPVERSEVAPEIPRSLRTEWNARDSDGTLIPTKSILTLDTGTNWARQCSIYYKKPYTIEDPANPLSLTRSRKWIEANSIAVLNVAGPSEKTEPGIGQLTYSFLMQLIHK